MWVVDSLVGWSALLWLVDSLVGWLVYCIVGGWLILSDRKAGARSPQPTPEFLTS